MSDDIRTLKIKDVLEPDVRAIDICIWGASRPDIFIETIKAFKKYVKFSGRLRYFLEDKNDPPKLSEESEKIAIDNGFSGIHRENVGSYAFAQTNAMDRWITAPYMFSLEDDWGCLRDLPLDETFDLMQKYEGLRQIRFNKRATMESKGQHPSEWITYEREFDLNEKKYILTLGDKWTTIPALWKMSFIRPKWEGRRERGYWFISEPNGPICRGLDYPLIDALPKFIEKHLGTFIWGPIAEPPFFSHNGANELSLRQKQGGVLK